MKDYGALLLVFFFLGYMSSSVRDRWQLYRKSRKLLVSQELLELAEALERKWEKGGTDD